MKRYLVLIALLALSARAMESKLAHLRANGASVVPTFIGQDKEKYVILGHEKGGTNPGTYDAFGGGAESHEAGIDIAAREFWEEAIAGKTMHLSKEDIKKQLKSKYTPDIIGYKSGKRSNFFVYITQLKPYWASGLKEKFNSARDNARCGKFREKDKLAQIKWSDFVSAIKNSKSSKDVKVSAAIIDRSGKVKKYKDGTVKLKEITLRPSLVSSLRQFFKGEEPVEIGFYGEKLYTKGHKRRHQYGSHAYKEKESKEEEIDSESSDSYSE